MIKAVTGTTITVNVNGGQGAITDTTTHNFVTGKAYAVNCITSTHGMRPGTPIKISDNSLTFGCGHNGATGDDRNKTYPRSTDPVSDRWLFISNVTTNAFDVKVLDSVPSTNTDIHAFVKSVSGGITEGDPLVAQSIPVDAVSSTTITINALDGYTSSNTSTHTFQGLSAYQYKPTDVSYNASTGVMTITSNTHGIKNGDKVLIRDNSLTFTCAMDNNYSEHSYPRITDPVSGDWLTVSNSTTNTFDVNVGKSPIKTYTPTGVDYNPSTGSMELEIGSHDFTIGTHLKIALESLTFTCAEDGNATNHSYPRATIDTHTATTGTTYNPLDGVLKITTAASHGIKNNDWVKFNEGAITFTCEMDENSTDHAYPRTTDPTFGKWLQVSNVTATTFEVTVGKSPSVAFTPTDATYDPATGLMVLDIGTHTLAQGTNVQLLEGAVSFNCDMDGGTATKSYPRSTIDNYTPTTASFAPTTGVLTVTVPQHRFGDGDWVKFDDNAFTFNCSMDGNSSNKQYPRTNDPTRGKWLQVSNVTENTFDVTVGATPIVNFDVTDATYNPTSGDMELTIGSHSLTTDHSIKLATESLTFTCDFNSDGNTTEKKYPRASGASTTGNNGADYAYDTAIAITATTATTITINVNGGQGAITDTTAHNFVSATAGAVISGGNYTHTFVSALANSVKMKRDRAYQNSLPIASATGTTITLDVGKSPLKEHTPTDATYDPTSGDMVITIGVHTLKVGTSVRLKPQSFVFSCDQGGTVGQGTYPRATGSAAAGGADYAYNNAMNITAVDYAAGTITINVNGGQGAITNTNAHTFVSAAAGAVVSGGGYSHTYASALTNSVITGGDYPHTFKAGSTNGIQQKRDRNYDSSIEITGVTPTTITVNAGISSNTTTHTFVGADPSALTTGGDYAHIFKSALDYAITRSVIQSGGQYDHKFVSALTNAISTGGNYTHTFVSFATNGITVAGDSIHIAPDSLKFTCDKDQNEEIASYPRKTDPSYNQILRVKDTSTTTITVNVGKSGENDQYAHTFSSATSNAITKSKYTTADCADVYTTTGNLMDILTDTLENANLASPVDHLGTITRVAPTYEFLGGTVNSYSDTPFNVDYHDATNDIVYTNQVDIDGRYRFRDAADLIRANRGPIIDKASYDMLQRYPDLALDMPRNADGTGAGTLRCQQDIGLIIDAIANDIEQGGNLNMVEAANFYIGTNDELQHIRLQVFQSVYAHDRIGFYAKQAVTGDLTTDNTDDIIVGDWGITNDGGGCADVKSAIDTLITTANDIIAPTGEDFHISADRLYFNRKYLADEITYLTTQEFTYQLNTVNYTAFQYPGDSGETTCQRDLKLIILSIISDLQTGGNNSTIAAIEKYLTATLQIDEVENELLPTIYSIELLKTYGEKAVRNLLYDKFTAVTGDQYAAIHTDEASYRDSETPTDINAVVYRLRDLVEIAVNMLAPGKNEARSAAKNIMYNKNYYLSEIGSIVNSQFGAGLWTYDPFVNELTDDIIHDIITTNVDNTTRAYKIAITGASGIYSDGELVTYSSGVAEVLEYDSSNSHLYIKPTTTDIPTTSDIIVGKSSGATSTYGSVVSVYDVYQKPTNVKIINTARQITSNIQGQISGDNIYTGSEDFGTAWTNELSTVTTDDTNNAPPDFDRSSKYTADKVESNTTPGEHGIHRTYALNAYDTFDDGVIKFDDATNYFDEGAIGIQEDQQYTFSVFVKAGTETQAQVGIILDDGTAGIQEAFFNINLSTGTFASIFQPQNGIVVDGYGVVPYGDGWYRGYVTCTFSFGFSNLKTRIALNNSASYNTATNLYVWGAKLNKGALDPYTAVSGKLFYSDTEYNIKQYAIDLLAGYIKQSITGTLTSPSTSTSFYAYYDSVASTDYDEKTVREFVNGSLDIIRKQLDVDTYYTGIAINNSITIPSKLYGTRSIPIGIQGGLNSTDFIYGTQSDSFAELETISLNQGKIVKIFQRFRIDGDITDGPFTMNETVSKQGAPSITGKVYAYYADANYKYLDVEVTAGPWAITDVVVGGENSTTAQISSIEDRMQVIDLRGTFTEDIPFKGYNSGNTAQPTGFLNNQAAVLDNTGGTLTVDTETLTGTFETTSVVYPESSRQYIEVAQYTGLNVGVGNRIASNGYIRLGVTIISGLNVFTVGNRLYKVVNGAQDTNTYGIITEVDLDNNYIYITEFQGTFTNGDLVGDYGTGGGFPVGYASISTKVTTAGAAAALVQDIRDVGVNKRLYLSDIKGTFTTRDSISGPEGYKSVVLSKQDLFGRVKRSFKGFDGTTSTFPLSHTNGTSYFPDPEGHLLVFINGILQPPGATNAYTAFSNQIQFTEAPELGASFTGFYVGKLRQLDDISFEFDSLRQSFNLKRNDIFYSLTLTEGVQSSTILPENNIIVSLNGVIQEPGVGFEIVGSRIIFSEIPRVGSTFVAFSYVGSEADVDAAEVVPPIEPGDFIDIQGETEDREVAVIESSNSLITFDYLGSVFGQDAIGQAVITNGFIQTVQVTAGGSGYNSRPTVRLDSISGFDGQIRALVGVAGVEMSAAGSGYQNPDVAVETSVPDDWTAPDLSLYGQELVDPEILP